MTVNALNEKAASVQPGDIIANRYRVEHALGVGGTGVVMAAHDTELDQPCAVKLMRERVRGDDEATARFLREVRVLARMETPHVARVFDFGWIEGAPYLVTELLEGEDLRALCKRLGPLPIDEAVHYMLEALDAIGEAHERGIVHRDLKPANLFLAQMPSGERQIKVIDFGISKIDGDDRLTNANVVLGSPFYMAPEQWSASRDVDARADVWSLGVIAYRLITGTTPFAAKTLGELCVQVTHDEPRPPSAHRDDIPPALDEAIMRCLAKSVGDRMPSATALRDALTPFARRPVARTMPLITESGSMVRLHAGAVARDSAIRERRQPVPSTRRPNPVSSALAPGVLIDDRFRLDAALPTDGDGKRFKAWHMQLDGPLTIEVPPSLPEAVEAFRQRARALFKVRSKHVLRVLSTSELADGVPYAAVELQDGGSLEARLREQGALGVSHAATLGIQLSDALQAISSAGAPPPALSPHTVFLTQHRDSIMSQLSCFAGAQGASGTLAKLLLHALGAEGAVSAADIHARRPDVPPPLAEVLASALSKGDDGVLTPDTLEPFARATNLSLPQLFPPSETAPPSPPSSQPFSNRLKTDPMPREALLSEPLPSEALPSARKPNPRRGSCARWRC